MAKLESKKQTFTPERRSEIELTHALNSAIMNRTLSDEELVAISVHLQLSKNKTETKAKTSAIAIEPLLGDVVDRILDPKDARALGQTGLLMYALLMEKPWHQRDRRTIRANLQGFDIVRDVADKPKNMGISPAVIVNKLLEHDIQHLPQR